MVPFDLKENYFSQVTVISDKTQNSHQRLDLKNVTGRNLDVLNKIFPPSNQYEQHGEISTKNNESNAGVPQDSVRVPVLFFCKLLI